MSDLYISYLIRKIGLGNMDGTTILDGRSSEILAEFCKTHPKKYDYLIQRSLVYKRIKSYFNAVKPRIK